jgi:transposase
LHLLTDGSGIPLAAALTPGQTHESKGFRPLLRAVRIPVANGGCWRRPRALAGDKAYSCAWIRSYLRTRGVERVIPQKADQVGRRGGHRKFDRLKYRQRHVIEQCVGWLKELRRLGTRFEKLAVNFLAMVKLGFVERYLRLLS